MFLDMLQPFALTGLSIYIALYRSDGDLLTALLNVVVLAFIASLDTVLLKRYLDMRYTDTHRICVAFLDIKYGNYVSVEESFWRHQSKTRREYVLQRLRSEDTPVEKKWEALIDTEIGLGILGNGTRDQFKGRQVVSSVALDASIYSWSDVDHQHLTMFETNPKIPWYLDAASEHQLTYEVPKHGRKTRSRDIDVDAAKDGDAANDAANKLLPGERLQFRAAIYSPNGRFRLVQSDSQLELYHGDMPIWSNAVYTEVYYIEMKDGNLVAYDMDNIEKWTTKTAGNPGAYLLLQDDGNLVIYSSEGKHRLWESGLWASDAVQPPANQAAPVPSAPHQLIESGDVEQV
ncbi:hypothetical protein GPECTOR_93g623 [Gonium pectorale]|uniref:Bulb-type lectin domain-containing protein n=1 Tax=Gonium pectorale TaxID=33097 RepID=A0A150G0E2_GONPE|nr:hypothetical protein GPECTOR_93g623 [Gonium pectorale]|eukprot:KXZ43353.1 hypothetical protein GPECTOR_93g623 [Gonium pectorale]